ncbi:hypothetical protein 035JT004_71 [Bacillus phage 035JT004]|nr:hypothetical protein 035JT004_71 [Bacillus phage 035JT004]
MRLNKYFKFKFKKAHPVVITLEQERALNKLVDYYPHQVKLLEMIDDSYDKDNPTEAAVHLGVLGKLPKDYLKEIIISQQYTVVDTMEDRIAYQEQLALHELHSPEAKKDEEYAQYVQGQLYMLRTLRQEYEDYLNSTASVNYLFSVSEEEDHLVLKPHKYVNVHVDDSGVITAKKAFTSGS